MDTIRNSPERLRLIQKAVQEAIDLADQGGEVLIGALLSAAQDAVAARSAELAPE